MQRQRATGRHQGHDRHVDDQRWGTERRLAALAGRQHGVVTRAQLLALGLGAGAIDDRVRKHRLHPVHRGVYLLGHRSATWRGREIAAILACGARAMLGCRSATQFWKLLPYPADPAPVDVTVVGSHVRARPGIRVHRVARLERRDWLVRDGIPVVTPARAVLELAAETAEDEVERAIAEGHVLGLVDERRLRDQLERYPRRPGTAALRRLLDVDGAAAPTRAESERRMMRLIRSAGLPPPEANARVGRFEVDFAWRRQHLVAEVDGYRFHSSRRRFERDRERDAELAAAGYTVIRLTWRQLIRAPEAALSRIAAALARRG